MRDPRYKPNIILVNCDDLGYGDLECYGSEAHSTPHLNRMAEEGMLFTNFYQASSLCSPSRGAMLTGCYPIRIGFDSFDGMQVLIPGQGIGLNPTEVTFATLLKDLGYATEIIGKWHCGDQKEFLPTRHGFDNYYGLPYSNDMGRQFSQELSPPLPLLRDEDVIEQQPDQASLTERYLEEAIRFIRDSRQTPFLLYFAHMYVHLPLYVQERFERESRNGRYGAAVACIDWAMGVLMYEIKRMGIERNTLILFTSDNGSRCDFGNSNGSLRGGKGTTWEGGQRLPLIAWWPNQIPAGSLCDEIVTGMDFLPTFARLAGTTPPSDRIIDGRDMCPLLFCEPDTYSPHEVFFYYAADYLDAVRVGKWKLFVGRHGWEENENNICELYDLDTDIGETNNLAAKYPQIVDRMMKQIVLCRDDIGDAMTRCPGENRRPIGRISNPRPLTDFDPNYPYYIAMYDLNEIG